MYDIITLHLPILCASKQFGHSQTARVDDILPPPKCEFPFVGLPFNIDTFVSGYFNEF